MLCPGKGNHCRFGERVCNILHMRGFCLGIIPNPHQQCRRISEVPSFQLRQKWTFWTHGCHALFCKEQIEPISLELVTFLLLFPLLRILLLGGSLLLLLSAFFMSRDCKLFLQGWENQHHLRVVSSISCPRESITDGIFANLVKHGVEDKLIGANKLGDILHHSHHLFGIRGERVHPSCNVEANNATTPCCKKWWRDFKRLRNAMTIDNNLRVLVSRLQAVDELLARVTSGDAIKG
mmetsp:Transcript_25413/g.46130  ORF Transcript_25413/g.46130 Transcript_25413/m.46130 type:complete len:236 (+) Transcript_25413:588-1295(+)